MLPFHALAFALLVAPEAGRDTGVIWAGAEIGDPLRARFVEELERRASAGAVVVDNADHAARAAIAFEVPRSHVDGQRGRLVLLETAESAYRGGDPRAALAGTKELIVGAHADPTAPGVVAVMIRAHLLRAQVAWTEGDAVGVDDALRAALVLDPDARASTRRLPPDLVARHDVLRAELHAARDTWSVPEVEISGDAMLEIDGRPGRHAVPPGEHLVIVRRPGAPPVGTWLTAKWSPPAPNGVLEAGLPINAVAAERVCTTLDLARLVLARRRGGRLGVQEYRCGVGYGDAGYGDAEDPAAVIAIASGLGVARDHVAAASALPVDGRWPVPKLVTGVPDLRIDDSAPAKPWWRRGWVWGVIATVVAGGIVTGAVVGTRDQPSGYVVDSDSFIDR